MTYVEVLLLIQKREETVLTQETQYIISNKHRYLRSVDVLDWQEDAEPGVPELHFGRGGSYYIWKRDETL